MGIEKVAFNFMVRTGKGKLCKSLLCYKPVKKLDISGLGVCFPNGNIHFQTEEAAIGYLKHRLLDSLNRATSQQFERAIAKRGTRILSEIDGTRTRAPIPFIPELMMGGGDNKAVRNIEIWHSHADLWGKGKTAPLSPPGVGDIELLNIFGLKKIVAMNRNGEINSMEVAEGYTLEKFKEFSRNFDNFMETNIIKLLPKDLQKRIIEIIKYNENNHGKKLSSTSRKEINELEQLCAKALKPDDEAKLMHEYYKTANKYGMKYYNDFSNL